MTPIESLGEPIPRPVKVVFEPTPNGSPESWIQKKLAGQYTKEQIEEAKTDIKNVVRLSLGVVPLDDSLALLSALEAAEQELVEYKRKAMHDACPECTAMKARQERAEAAESRIKELEEAGEKMRPHCILREACDEWDALIDATNR